MAQLFPAGRIKKGDRVRITCYRLGRVEFAKQTTVSAVRGNVITVGFRSFDRDGSQYTNSMGQTVCEIEPLKEA